MRTARCESGVPSWEHRGDHTTPNEEDLFPLKGVQKLSVAEKKQADSCWFPFWCTLLLCGVHRSTISKCRHICQEVFQNTGVRGLATTIKIWSKATRDILANEAHTKADKDHKVGYAKAISRWRSEVESRKLATPSELTAMIAEQGLRGIPPYLIDPTLIKLLLPLPNRQVMEQAVPLSNLSRTQPCPDEAGKIQGLHEFKRTVEAPEIFDFSVRKVVAKVLRTVTRAGLREGGIRQNETHWSFTGHASLDSTREQDGKRGEVRRDIIDGFMNEPLTNLFSQRPEHPVLDLFGQTVITPETWAADKIIGQAIYLDHCVGTPQEVEPDGRLGYIGVLWALRELVFQEGVIIDDDFYEGQPGLYSPGVEPRLEIIFAALDTKVEPICEEGWKVRIVTVTALCATVIGHLARHLIDPFLLADPCTKIGLRDKVKLWSFINHCSVRQGRGMPPLCTLGDRADSVDLTTATDVPPRRIVNEVIDGALDGINHKHDNLLRFAAELVKSSRTFTIRGYSEIGPIEHNRGIMMGEPMSGVFLNAMSMTIRALIQPWLKKFPETAGSGMTVPSADAFLRENTERVRDFLENVEPDIALHSTQSGDDAVFFGFKEISNALKILYRIFEMKPSDSTWYSSDRYALFTEEAAVRTPDDGWKFVDTIKPRGFVPHGSSPDTVPILGKLEMISNYVRYIVEERGDQDPIFQRSIYLSDLLIRKDPRLINLLRKEDLPIGLPRNLGGLSHPVGYQSDYVSRLTERNKKLLFGYLSDDPLTLCRHEFLMSEGQDCRDADPEYLELMLQMFLDMACQRSDDGHYEILLTSEDILEALPEADRTNNWKKVEYCKRNFLETLPQALGRIRRGLTFKAALSSEEKPPKTNQVRRVRRLLDQLTQRYFDSQPIMTEEDTPKNIRDVIRKVQAKRNSLFIPMDYTTDYLAGSNLPLLIVRFLTPEVKSPESPLGEKDDN